MPPLTPIEQFEFGGVDSRSNPLNLPAKRYLYMKNLSPKNDGHLQLRDGYTQVSTSGVAQVAGAIHSMYPFQFNGDRYLVYWVNKTPYTIRLRDGLKAAPTVKGTAIASSNRWTYALTHNGHLLAFNGVDKKFFDGVAWRNCGLPVLDPTDPRFTNAQIFAGVREISTSEAAAVTNTLSAGGTFPADMVGRSVYICFFDPTANSLFATYELGPATVPVGAQVQFAANQKLVLTGMPDVSGLFGGVFNKLVAITDDAGAPAYFLTNAAIAISGVSAVAETVTLNVVAHGLSAGNVIGIAANPSPGNSNLGIGVGQLNGIFAVHAVVDADHFTILLPNTNNAGLLPGGTIQRIIATDAATTTATVLGPTTYRLWVVNQERGIPSTSVATANAGYQLYVSVYNRVGGGHVGNRVAFGPRLKPTIRTNYHLNGFNQLYAGDAESEILIGRTDDGGSIPYAVIDNGGNWISTNASASPYLGSLIILSEALTDGNSELPIRNGVPPAFNHVWREGDRMCGSIDGSPTVYRSESEADANSGIFVGDPAQSWAADNIETFPTAEGIIAGIGYDLESWVFTSSAMGILGELAGALQWRGGQSWNKGIAGEFAFAVGWNGLPFWVSEDKELCTMTESGPVVVSKEYESALLTQIGDAYLAKTEVIYFQDTVNDIELLRIKCLDANGNPFTVIHDFNLVDERSPYGQGYQEAFTGVLATDFTTVYSRDGNGRGRVYAGASDGHFYLLHSGANDNGAEYLGEALGLFYLGPNRRSVKSLDWFGDPNVKWYISKYLDSAFDVTTFTSLNVDDPPEQIQEDQSPHANGRYRVRLDDPEITHAYVWMQLQSHSADGDFSLSVPPHIPLETYGRIWMVEPDLDRTRPK